MALDIHLTALDSAPLPSATVMLLRDAPAGLEVLMMRRHGDSAELGGVYVFPGGKLDADDQHPSVLQCLSQDAATLHHRLCEPELSEHQAAGLFVAAMLRMRWTIVARMRRLCARGSGEIERSSSLKTSSVCCRWDNVGRRQCVGYNSYVPDILIARVSGT